MRLLLDLYWYKYLFGSFHPPYKKTKYKWPGFRVVWCRFREHPYGVVWYNTAGLDPDMRCKGCGEDLG